jgi:hypothetical protein
LHPLGVTVKMTANTQLNGCSEYEAAFSIACYLPNPVISTGPSKGSSLPRRVIDKF